MASWRQKAGCNNQDVGYVIHACIKSQLLTMRNYYTLPLVVLIVSLFTGCAGSRAMLSPFQGVWEYYVEDPEGERYAGTLMVRSVEGVVSGTISNNALSANKPLEDVVTMDNQLMFVFDAGSYGEIDVTVVVDEDTITGEFLVDAIGEMPLSGSRLSKEVNEVDAMVAENDAPPAISSHPDSAKIFTTDIPNFWAAFDAAQPEFNAAAFDELYISKGSPGVEGFVPNRIQNATNLADVVKNHQNYYTSIRQKTLKLVDLEPPIRKSFHAFKSLYPEAVFPDVFIVIGALNSGGTVSDRALIIGAEMFGKSEESVMDELSEWHQWAIKMPQEIHYTVAHELIHFQQHYPSATLLEQSIKEGSADFIGELISGKTANENIPTYADSREAALWQEFQEIMHGNDFAGWLYGGSGIEGRPADLGYWMGYKIVEAYYNKMGDKKQAIQDIINIEDASAFLEASGYSSQLPD